MMADSQDRYPKGMDVLEEFAGKSPGIRWKNWADSLQNFRALRWRASVIYTATTL
jgi:hypothetical protein